MSKNKKKLVLQSKKQIFCKEGSCPDLKRKLEMELNHREVPDLVLHICEKCNYIGSMSLQYKEDIWNRKELLETYICEIEEQIKFEESELQNRKDTMVHFSKPEERVIGIDIIKYQLELPILKNQLAFLKKQYKESYGQRES